jgi:hypothetical protein
MVPSRYIEDIFVEFYNNLLSTSVKVKSEDLHVCDNFYNIIITDSQKFTKNQANFILRILDKYKIAMTLTGFDYSESLKSPVWKNSFRTIDTTKRAWIEQKDKETPVVCLQFPYQFKSTFDKEFVEIKNSFWDAERKIRTIDVYSINLVHLHDFFRQNNFEIDESFLTVLDQIEEIWQQQEQILPSCEITESRVKLVNPSDDIKLWWDQNKKNNLYDDLLLAKSMGFLLKQNPSTTIEKIASVESNQFWLKTNDELLSLYKNISGKICVVLDRTGNIRDWLERFSMSVEKLNVKKSDIRICFRLNKNEDQGLNQWIKDNEFGGSVNSGRILIFNHRPAKWIFNSINDIKILISNNLYPSTSLITREWFESHPCVIYLGDIKPSESRNQKIVEL